MRAASEESGERGYGDREVMTEWNRGVVVPGWRPRITLRDGLARLLEVVPEICTVG